MTAHPFEWLTFTWLIIPSVGKDEKDLELPYTAHGNAKWSIILENSFGPFFKN